MSGPLKNQRHERFAQELAKGATADAAYIAAGFKENRGNAARLNAKESIRARVSEILGRAANKAEVTIASITDRLLKIADKAEKDELGAAGLSVSRAAMMDAAKLNGLIVEKTKTEITNPDGSLRPTVIRIVAADDRSGNSASA